MYCCIECGRKFKTIGAAERAADRGCPNCGGVDIDLDTRPAAMRATGPVVDVAGPISDARVRGMIRSQDRPGFGPAY